MTGSLGKRYARALFGLAKEANALDVTAEELKRATLTFDDPALRAIVQSPAVPATARLAVAKKVVEALAVSKTIGNLVALLAERDRLALLPDVSRWFQDLVDKQLGRARVVIRSAAALSAGEEREIVELARKITGRERVIASTEVDPTLLGGVVLDVEGTVYDGSLKSQLSRLAKGMASGGA